MEEYQGWDLWRRWVLAHVMGAALGILAGCIVGAVVGGASLFVCSYCAFVIGPGAGWIAFALALAWAQQLVLWPYSPGTWTRNTLLGFVIALPLSLVSGGGTVLSPLNWMWAGVVGGTILALAQWPLLRPGYAGAWLWIPANALAWSLGGGAAYAVNAFLTEATGLATLHTPLAFLAPILDPLASAGTALVLVAAITGGALLWMQRAGPPAVPQRR